MFVERLTHKQVKNLAESLVRFYEEFEIEDFEFLISQDRQGAYWSVLISLKKGYCKKYLIDFKLYDYDTIVYDTGLLAEGTINKNSVKFMYQTFGEEYKKAYLDKAAEIFE